jgi:hypothetical protein
MIGRGLRTAPGKADCLILDHSDTTLRLGFVTDIHHATLDDGKPKKASSGGKERPEPLPKDCPKCAFLKPAKVHVCPSCGFAPERQSKIECDDGELIELDARRKAGAKATAEEKADFYGQLQGYGQIRNYSPGWASYKFKEKYGVWPNHYRDVPPCEPTPETVSWIKSRQIAHAKSKARAA